MTPEELTLRQLEIEAETKRQAIRAGIWKVALGTAVVGIAAAFFPFAQQYATEYFTVQIEIMKQRAALEIKARESEITTTTLNRDFLASVATEGRSKNLEDRIILADYYYYLAEDESERERWEKFRAHLLALREQTREAKIEAAIVAANPESSAVDIARTAAQARVLEESSAAGGAAQRAPALAADPDLRSMIEDLSSDDSKTRRGARSALAARGLSLVRPAMIELSDDAISYRDRLGLVVALTEMLRENKPRRLKVIELLQPHDLDRLALAATDSDRTLRIHAAEFLYDLGDPRAFDIAAGLWDLTEDDNSRYNLALIMKGAAPYLEASDAARARARLERLKGIVGPKTDSLLNDAIGLLPS